MKEATGELNMTVITVVALAAVALLFYSFVWPMIKARIVQQTCDAMGSGYTVKEMAVDACTAAGGFPAEADDADNSGKIWCCLPEAAATN